MTSHDDDDAQMQQLSRKLTEANLPACSIRPHPTCPLFVAWNGVLVLVYEAFPPSFLKAKKIMAEWVLHLTNENFGSKWPKTTLAAVVDTAPDLLLEEMTRLKWICEVYSQKIIDLMAADDTTTIAIPSISLVQYECRSLEKLHSRVDVSFLKKGHNGLEEEPSSDEQKEIVQSVVDEWATPSVLSFYLTKVNAPGSRLASYRTTYQGATCVAFLESALPGSLGQILKKFRMAVDLEFPGRYAWLAEDSLHCTLRSLDAVVPVE